MRNGSSTSGLTFRRMNSDDRREVFALFSELVLREDYREVARTAHTGTPPTRASAEAALGEALTLFIERPDYGFVFVALENDRPVACATISYTISLSLGKIVAELQHLVVTAERRRRGIGSELIEALIEHLRIFEIARLDVEIGSGDEIARRFYLDLGFKATHEECLALVL